MGRHLAGYRRPVAALFAAAATAFGLLALRPEPAPTGDEILVAARDLPAGATLRPTDLRTARLPPTAIPSGAILDPAEGRVLAGPMRRGEPLTDVRLVSGGLLRAYGPGTVATPVRIADPGAVRLLHQGDHVDVLATDPPQADALPGDAPGGSKPAARAWLVVASVPVVAVPKQQAGDEGALVVLATDRSQAAALTAAGPNLAVTIT